MSTSYPLNNSFTKKPLSLNHLSVESSKADISIPSPAQSQLLFDSAFATIWSMDEKGVICIWSSTELICLTPTPKHTIRSVAWVPSRAHEIWVRSHYPGHIRLLKYDMRHLRTVLVKERNSGENETFCLSNRMVAIGRGKTLICFDLNG
jgi:hypothetical protein